MWCIECGAKLIDGAKFCMECGTKVPVAAEAPETVNAPVDTDEIKTVRPPESESYNEEIESVDDTNTQDIPKEQDNAVEIEEDDGYKHFSFLGHTVKVPKSMEMYVNIRSIFSNLAFDASEQFENYYINKYRSFEGLIKMADKDVKAFMDKAYSEGVDILNDLGIYNINYDRFVDICDKYTGYWEEDFGGLYDKYCDLMEYKNAKQNYRRQRKAGRGRMVGGGFGLSGAIKGAAMAGSINAASGVFHSLTNAMGNAATSGEVSSAMNKLYKSQETKEVLSDAIYSDIFYMFKAVVEIINASNQYPVLDDYTSEEFNEASILYENVIEGKIRDEDLKNVFFKILLKQHHKV